tara:strand:+ start:48 stop:533 length:486 start_codon:yes stop_codon:yes gene_type:complete
MAYQKLQTSSGLNVIPSNTVPIPDRATKVLDGTADFSVAGTLTDVGTTFLSAGIQKNAIVYNITDQKAYFVLDVTDDLNLSITSIAGGSASAKYYIYNAPTNGCILYVGTGGDVAIQFSEPTDSPSGELIFKNIPNASFLPVQAIRIDDTLTTATDIIALW